MTAEQPGYGHHPDGRPITGEEMAEASERMRKKQLLDQISEAELRQKAAFAHLDALKTERKVYRMADAVARREVEQELAGDREPLELVPAAQVWDEPDLTYLVQGLIPDTGIGALFGQTGTWKSFLALHLILSVIYGLGFLGRPVDRPGWCFYLLGEGQRGARRRLRAAMADLPVPGRDLPPPQLGYLKVPFPLSDEEAVDELIAAMRAWAGRETVSLVTLDAAADFYPPGADEIRAADMEPVIRAAKRIARELSCFVLLIAHSGYDGGHVRGTSRFGQAWDFEAQAERDSSQPGRGWLRVTKSKEDEAGYAIPFRVVPSAGSLAVRSGRGGQDQDQDAEPLATVIPLSAAEQRVQDDVLRYLREHAGERGLSFRRIDQGVKGRQQIKRQVLDQMSRVYLVAEADGPNNSKLYRPGAMAEWMDKHGVLWW